MRVGSLCTGIAGLELGLQYAGIETKPVFVSDIDPGACDWLDQTMPHTPNLGDFTQLDELPECDILTAGFPCQPLSFAGQRQGINDERWLFDDICRLVSRMDSRPVLFLENVSGILTANSGEAMARVVYGLADIGYYITWGTLPAVAVGAPHRRNRWWGVAWHPDSPSSDSFTTTSSVGNPVGKPNSRLTADAENIRHEWTRQPRRRGTRSADSSDPAADTNSATRPQRDIRQAAGRSVQHGHDAERRDMATLGQIFAQWAPAVARWEHILGRSAPDPHIEQRLNPAFVEWMMGYPEGWVTDIMTKRTHSLKALGNAVVPQCAAEAFLQLSTR